MNKLNVKNLILYHTEESHGIERKKLYTFEGKQYFDGNVLVPDDLEIININNFTRIYTFFDKKLLLFIDLLLILSNMYKKFDFILGLKIYILLFKCSYDNIYL